MNKFCVSLFLLVCLFYTKPVQGEENPYQWILNMMSREKSIRREAAAKLMGLQETGYLPGMVDVLFYMPRNARGEMVEILEKKTGHKSSNSYYEWVEYIGARPDLKSPPDYVRFKSTLLSLIDPTYKKILYTGVPRNIRAEEIVWGGVGLDGIPPIDSPQFIPAADAKLSNNELVFGLSHKGESRAYPLRYLSWHEMLNDRIGGDPITISY